MMAVRTLIVVAALSVAAVFSSSHAQESRDLIDIGNSALWIDISGNLAYVTNPEDGAIVVIDTNTGQVVDTIGSMAGVIVLEVVGEQNKLYATVDEYAPVLVYDLATGEKIREIDIGSPNVTLYSKADTNYGQREYVTFQTNAVGLEYNPDTELLYAIHTTVNRVAVIDTRTDTHVDSIVVGRTPLLISIDETRNIGYVTNRETNNISVLDLESNDLIKSISTGFVPDQMAMDQANNRLYVTHHASPHVAVIDLRTQEVETDIQMDGPTHALAFNEADGLLHVTYMPESGFTGPGATGKVEFIDTDTNAIVGSFELDANPFSIAIDSPNQRLMATIIDNGTVISVDLANEPNYQNIVSDAASAEAQPGGGCLIATAAYGTELAPQVQLLREVRDNVVLETQSGAAFLSGFNYLYYSISPTIADIERENPVFRYLVGALVTPMIYSLHIMTLTDGSSESAVVLLGLAVIALNIAMYVAVPAWAGLVILKYIKSPDPASLRRFAHTRMRTEPRL